MFSELLEHEKSFQDAIAKVRHFSQKKREEAKARKVTHLSKYKNTFAQLNNLADLTWLKVKTRLIKGKNIF